MQRPSSTPIDTATPDGSQAALEKLLARSARVASMQGEAKLLIEAPEGGGKVTALVAVQRPSQARIDLVTLLGPLRAAAIDGDLFRLVDFDARRVVDAPADEASWERLVGVRVAPAHLIALLCGVVPVDAGAKPVSVELAGDREILTVEVGSERWAVESERATGRPSTLASLDWTARFERYDGPEDLPLRIRVESNKERRALELRWKERVVNRPIDAKSLWLTVPKGFRNH